MTTISHTKSELFVAPIKIEHVFLMRRETRVHLHVNQSLKLLQLNYKLNGFKNFSWNSPIPNLMEVHSTVCEFIYAHRCDNYVGVLCTLLLAASNVCKANKTASHPTSLMYFSSCLLPCDRV
jgi:hypothetical protein